MNDIRFDQISSALLEAEGAAWPSPYFAGLHNAPAYEEAKKTLPIPVRIHKAYYAMLMGKRLLRNDDARVIGDTLQNILFDEFHAGGYGSKIEDLYYASERRMEIGILEKDFMDVAGHSLHVSHEQSRRSLDIENFIQVCSVRGGPAEQPMVQPLETCAKKLDSVFENTRAAKGAGLC